MPVRTVPLTAEAGVTFGVQSPGDRLDYAFLPFLDVGEALLSPTLAVSPGDLTIGGGAIAGDGVVFWAEGGTASTVYAIGCVVPTSAGRVLVGRASLFVGAVGLDDPSAVAMEG